MIRNIHTYIQGIYIFYFSEAARAQQIWHRRHLLHVHRGHHPLLHRRHDLRFGLYHPHR